MLKSMIICISFLMTIVFITLPAAAQDLDFSMVKVKISPSKNTILGIGAGVYPDYEGSEEFTGLPLLQVQHNWTNGCYVNLLGTGLRANVIPHGAFEFGPLMMVRPERDSVKEKQVDNLKKIDAATEVGAFASWSINRFMLLLQARKDVSDTHDGYLVDVGAACRVPLERNMQLIMIALASYASDDYMKTYFGIDVENGARSELPEYETFPEHKADAGVRDVALMAVLQYNLNSDWGLLGLLKYSRLLGDAADSPVVKDIGNPNQLMTGIIVNYSF